MTKEPVFPQHYTMTGGGYITVRNKTQLDSMKIPLMTGQARPIEAIPADVLAAVAAAELAAFADPVPTPAVNQTDAAEATARSAEKARKGVAHVQTGAGG